jgi:serine protease Do
MKQLRSNRIAAIIGASLVLAATGLLIAATPNPDRHAANEAKPAVLSPETLNIANAMSDAFRSVSKQVLPAVVAIENRPDTSWQASGARDARPDGFSGRQNPFKGTPFEDMFRDQVPMTPRHTPRPQAGIGSGVIIDSSGIILTNNHVVAGGGKVIVKTQDGREFVATEVLTDPQTDIAVIKIDGDESLTAAALGNSDQTSVGDWVVALGQPFGLESTVTAGIVSAKNRGIGITDRENFIQTDAAINPGNSGGPLVNLHGEVIGINTAISSRNGGNSGIGFAVPSNLARWVSDQLIASGRVQRSYLGVGIQPVSHELAGELGVDPRGGVAITNVFADTPAEKTGLKAGDVIVKFGGSAINTPQKLQLEVERSTVGKPVTIDVIRDRKRIELTYKPEIAPGDFGAATSNSRDAAREGMKMQSLGVEVSEMTSDVAKQLGLEQASGLVITSVQSDGAAAQAGLKPGMVIAQANRKDLQTVAEFLSIIESDDDGAILLLVRSEQGSRFVVVQR